MNSAGKFEGTLEEHHDRRKNDHYLHLTSIVGP